MAWTQAGNFSLTTVWAIVYGTQRNGFDPFAGNSFGAWHPNGARIGFEQEIIDHVYANAPADNGNPAWYTCRYCNWEYPIARCQIDHIVPWEDYSLTMTTSRPISGALALQVWAGCNDPANLAVACDSCNASKGNRAATAAWVAARVQLANQNHGF